MSKVLVSESNLQAIANAIRARKSSSDTMLPSEMGDNILNISPYIVSSIQERDALDANEGDVCIVYSRTQKNWEQTDTVSSFYFPAKVVLPETGDFFLNFQTSDGETAEMELTSTACNINAYTDTDTRISYTSVDGLTYTKSQDDYLTFSSALESRFDWNDLVGYFFQVENLNFPGIYIYENDAWEYLKIGCEVSNTDLEVNHKAYTDNGIVTGSHDSTKYKDILVYLQLDAPGTVEGLWLKPWRAPSQFQQIKNTRNIYYTALNPNVTPKLTSLGDYKSQIGMQSKSKHIDDMPYTLINENVYYVLNNALHKFNMKTGALTQNLITLPSITGESYDTSRMDSDGDHTIMLARKGNVYLLNLLNNSYTQVAKPYSANDGLGIFYDRCNNRFMSVKRDSNYTFYAYNISNNTWTSSTYGSYTNVSDRNLDNDIGYNILYNYFRRAMWLDNNTLLGNYRINLQTKEYLGYANKAYDSYAIVDNNNVIRVWSNGLEKTKILSSATDENENKFLGYLGTFYSSQHAIYYYDTTEDSLYYINVEKTYAEGVSWELFKVSDIKDYGNKGLFGLYLVIGDASDKTTGLFQYADITDAFMYSDVENSPRNLIKEIYVPSNGQWVLYKSYDNGGNT